MRITLTLMLGLAASGSLSAGDLDAGHGIDASPPTLRSGFRGSAEYLLWWIKDAGVPPLLTEGGTGIVGTPGTTIAVDSLDFADRFRQGGRFTLGYRWESNPRVGAEVAGFFLDDRSFETSFASSGNPVLARPYTNAVTGLPDTTRISTPGVASGSSTIASQSSFWGIEQLGSYLLVDREHHRLGLFGGFRFVELDERLTIDEQFDVDPSVPGFGGNHVFLQDQFQTDNNFYGGTLGVRSTHRWGRFHLDLLGKIALGDMIQTADINGLTHVVAADGTVTDFRGGLLALPTNIGGHRQHRFAVIPEVGLNLGYRLSRYLELSAGYSLLWINTVARPGDQIDPVINNSQFPILSGNGPLVGPARPSFTFHTTDFWAQGLTFRLAVTY
ncbi:hypothetical protein Pan216_03470 [Planctomycetes bacterium Pan216]|uniref:Outer membrane protein beta-barrel domain-containing protein n=1 Tax=Kolteria novifilia TaxID=2527975 RepID=A0A518AXR0_9BACT|nr:hypothetical protein Pan216_03470 [Planctomycetes bacterium Pan216]